MRWQALLLVPLLLVGCASREQHIVTAYQHVKFWDEPTCYLEEPATPQDLYSEKYGPRLLQDPTVIDPQLKWLDTNDTSNSDALYAKNYSLYFAALRLQGHSTAQILQRPDGIDLFLGTLLCELNPPALWTSCGWLESRLQAHPQGALKLGLLDDSTVQATLKTLFDDPRQVYPIISAAKGDKAITPRRLHALLAIAQQDQPYLSLDQNSALLDQWKVWTDPDGLPLSTRCLPIAMP